MTIANDEENSSNYSSSTSKIIAIDLPEISLNEIRKTMQKNKHSSIRHSYVNFNSFDLGFDDASLPQCLTNFDENNKIQSNNKSVNSRNKIEIPLPPRPPTARSLPSKVQSEEEESQQLKTYVLEHSSQKNSKSNNLIQSNKEQNETSKANNLTIKITSCPTISPDESKTTFINVLSKNEESNNQYKHKHSSSLKHSPTSTTHSQPKVRSEMSTISSSSASSSSASKRLASTSGTTLGKSNLDYFIDYTSSPFTTKFEMLGDANKQSSSQKIVISNKHINSSNSDLNTVDSARSKLTRSQSISNLNKDKILVENILSPNQVKPYTSLANNNQNTHNLTSKSNSTMKNSSANNLFYQYSLNDANNEEEDIHMLKKSISDEKLSNDHLHEAYNKNSATNSSSLMNFYRITEHLYAGNLKSIRNERKMCKLGIEYLIDLTNMKPDELNRKSLAELPCLCKRQHSRLYLAIEITDTSFKSLFNAFSEVNKFIQKARKASNNRKVLIFGKESFSSVVVCACSQYLMVEYEMSLKEVLDVLIKNNTIENGLSLNQIEKCYIDYLRKFESYIRHMSLTIYGANMASPSNLSNKKQTSNKSTNSDVYFDLNEYDSSTYDDNSDIDRVTTFTDTSLSFSDKKFENENHLANKTQMYSNDVKKSQEANGRNSSFKLAWM